MTDQHPITPPPELVKEWVKKAHEEDDYATFQNVATQAARWGADQQLEMDAGWVQLQMSNQMSAKRLIAEMRPKPPSLKEQALDSWDRLRNEAWRQELDLDLDLIRRALEALPND